MLLMASATTIGYALSLQPGTVMVMEEEECNAKNPGKKDLKVYCLEPGTICTRNFTKDPIPSFQDISRLPRPVLDKQTQPPDNIR